jgi:hypothetical protein
VGIDFIFFIDWLTLGVFFIRVASFVFFDVVLFTTLDFFLWIFVWFFVGPAFAIEAFTEDPFCKANDSVFFVFCLVRLGLGGLKFYFFSKNKKREKNAIPRAEIKVSFEFFVLTFVVESSSLLICSLPSMLSRRLLYFFQSSLIT